MNECSSLSCVMAMASGRKGGKFRGALLQPGPRWTECPLLTTVSLIERPIGQCAIHIKLWVLIQNVRVLL